MKILICGHGGHGKTTLARHLGLPYTDSTKIAMESIVWPSWGLMEYDTMRDCHEDRRNQRARWQRTIAEFNHKDKARFGRLVFGYCNIYAGCRDQCEFNAMKAAGVFDVSIFVDAIDRLPLEQGMTVTPDMCGIVVHNNGTLKEFMKKIDVLREVIHTV